MLDGRLARETGTVTKAGAFFDSCSDRYSDSFVFIGIAIYFLSKSFSSGDGHFILSVTDYSSIIIIKALMLGTAAMSYVKARGKPQVYQPNRGLCSGLKG
jgi:phosphatidylglycerophosphate synthase